MRKTLSITILLFTACIAMWAVPARRDPIVRQLENGTTDTIYLYGDENASFTSKKRLSRLPQLPVQAPQRTMRSAYVPREGKVRIPVLLVNFTDLSFSLPDAKAQFEDFFNGSGGSNPNATGSVHSYFSASSYNILDLEYEVFGPLTLSHDMAYYGANRTNSSGVTTGHNIRASELVTEAVQLAVSAGVDFSRFDANNDGNIDNVSIIVAGYNEAEGGKAETIWPHYSVISESKRYNGKYLSGYLMISEYRSSGGKTQAGIGTYCHEFGHALGLPDLYDTSSSNAYTVGEWDIMCSGSYNNNGSTPPSYTAFERFVMGWLTPQQVTASGLRTLRPIETASEALLIAASSHNLNPTSPSPNEYFLIENRQSVDWDAGRGALVGTGMMVSHITFNNAKWENNTFNTTVPLGFSFVSAGVTVQTQSSAADPFPGSTRRTSWRPTLNDGTVLNAYIVSQIRQREDGDVAMYIGPMQGDVLAFAEEEVILSTTYFDSPINYDTVSVHLHIPPCEQDSILLYVESNRFYFSTDIGSTWHSEGDTAIIHIDRNRSYDLPVLIVHTPNRQSCVHLISYLSAISQNEEMGTQLTVKGVSPKPHLVTTPVVDSITNIHSTSFSAFWEEQEEADGYFFTLYTLGEGDSEEIENFEDFASLNQIKERGWYANFANTQSTVSQSGSAVLFTETDQYIQTPAYIYPPTQLSFWLSNNYTPNSADEAQGGQLLIYGSTNGRTWDKITTVNIQRITKNITRTVDLDTALHYNAFRITYTHWGGNGGTVIDTWAAHYPFELHYLFSPREHMVYHGNNTVLFRDLTPATTYYFALQAYEESGCEPYYSTMSAPCVVTTPNGDEDAQLSIRRIGVGKYTVTIPDMEEQPHYLAIYDYTGHMLQQLHTTYTNETIELPALPVGQLYLIKCHSGKMKRKNLNAKILSH